MTRAEFEERKSTLDGLLKEYQVKHEGLANVLKDVRERVDQAVAQTQKARGTHKRRRSSR